ncbi:RagB/SusD family nutrient uptake outer membrane protein [Olivibacter domesticus]|uniref:SusD family protein n=1 Tax=Olivibacter domesticus TaxID=407022 RepID=A0A1H7GPJ8_OLID1|nr:RagB/SusD family nutrient uptake outer membrane protein [Olivibacter domesticus]SEK40028.1 SusD family protein [Olivibacter domesticus]
MIYRNILLLPMIVLLFTQLACKDEWLDKKPNKSLVVPKRVEDFQALLDNVEYMNQNHTGALSEIGTDNLILPLAAWQTRLPEERNAYIWGPTETFYEGTQNAEWFYGYERIQRVNIVIDGLKDINENTAGWQNAMGSALFFRAFDLYNLAQLFCKPWLNSDNASLGLVLRQSSNINEAVKRSTLAETYGMIINDLEEAITLLPDLPEIKTRPSKAAVYALLARIYLSMEDYEQSLLYADSSLNIFNEVLDFNGLNLSGNNPVSRLNSEVILHCRLVNYGALQFNRMLVDTNLYSMYEDNDLRKLAYFRTVSGGFAFKGSFDGSGINFCGFTTGELLLIKAECAARLEDSQQALISLKVLLDKRYLTGTSPSLTELETEGLLLKILNERRKELCFRGLRWADLRRLNRDSHFAKIITRYLGADTYDLLPNDIRYILPIDDNEILLTSIQQNIR